MDSPLPMSFANGELQYPPVDCLCGRRHQLPFDRVVVRPGALEELPALLSDQDSGETGSCCIVADQNTFDAAGREVDATLRAAGLPVTVSLIGPTDDVRPDQSAVGALLLDMSANIGMLIAVGSGCITDVTRYVAARTRTPFISVPTAPSVDAYTSNNSPMTHHGVKRTLPAVPARAVIADTNVLAASPAVMIASGFGDTVGKLTSRADWRLSSVVTGEYFCDEIEKSVTAGVRQCADLASAIGQREPHAITTLMESLMVSGTGMVLVGNSRPASGAEHSLSHYWEMKAEYQRGHEHLHGTKVGVGTTVVAAFWEQFAALLKTIDPDSLDSQQILSSRRTPDDIRKLLGPSLGPIGDMLVDEVTIPRLPSETDAAARLQRLQSSWEEMAAIAAEVPSVDEVAGNLRQAEGAVYPADLEVNADELREALLCALEVRGRFTVLTAAESLGWLDQIVDEVIQKVGG